MKDPQWFRNTSRRPQRGFWVVLLLPLLPFPLTSSVAQERAEEGRFRDPQDGRFDMSAHLAGARGFLPTASPITEPAVGYGLSAAAAFFHRPSGWSLEAAREAFERGEAVSPPSVSLAAGGFTSNESWFVGGGHLGIWRGDRYRYMGFGGYGSFNLTLAGLVGGEESLEFDYNLEGWVLSQSLRRRLGDSNWLLGAQWAWTSMSVRFKSLELPELGSFAADLRNGASSRNGGVGAVLAYDSRDNIFSPNRGYSLSVAGRRFDDAFLGDHDYWQGTLSAAGWGRLTRNLTLGVRGLAGSVGDGAPFWGLPTVQMRGVPARQYSGSSEVQGEGEARWDLDSRWSLVGFGGLGWTRSEVLGGVETRTVGAGGGGIRYLLARAFGIRGGIDVAYGPDGGAVYLTMGNAWR